MTSYISMKWPVRAETIWVFNSLIGMMSCASTMKSATFKKTDSRMENRQFARKKKKLE